MGERASFFRICFFVTFLRQKSKEKGVHYTQCSDVQPCSSLRIRKSKRLDYSNTLLQPTPPLNRQNYPQKGAFHILLSTFS